MCMIEIIKLVVVTDEQIADRIKEKKEKLMVVYCLVKIILRD